MPSVWISPRKTKSGLRHDVRCQLGGRGTRTRRLGTFKSRREAEIRKRWALNEIAALRVPNPRTLLFLNTPTLREATETWRTTRIDVSERTRTNDRVNTERVFKHDPKLATTPLNEIDWERWAEVFRGLGQKHGTLKKTKEAFGMVYDHHEIDPNPLRDKRVKLPQAEVDDSVVPIAAHVTAVAHALPRHEVLPFLLLDWTGFRGGALEKARIADLDERGRSILARAQVAKNRKPVWVKLPDALFGALLAELPAREDRDLDALLLPAFKLDNLRTAITRACRLSGTPPFSPKMLRKRRGSLLLKQGYTVAEVAGRLADTKAVTAEHYLYAMSDYEEVEYEAVLSERPEVSRRVRRVRTPVRTRRARVASQGGQMQAQRGGV